MAKKQTEECPVCCEGFTKSKRHPVACPYCQYTACSTCCATYLTGDRIDPQCMNCHAAWQPSVVQENFTKAFVSGPLKRHRQETLLDREKALLPASTHLVDNWNHAKRLRTDLDTCYQQQQLLRQQLTHVERVMMDRNRRLNAIVGSAYAQNAEPAAGEADPATGAADPAEAAGGAPRQQRPRPCPAEGCRGFLTNTPGTSTGVCNVCQRPTCLRCMHAKAEGHECNEDDVETVRLLQRETKPCPSCSAAIQKVDGCDQMWCTICHTAFSWRTGQAVTGRVHNPHYFQWLTQQAADGGAPAARREIGDVPCGGVPYYYDHQLREVMAGASAESAQQLMEILRRARHCQYVQLPRAQQQARAGEDNPETANQDLRLQYMINQLDEDEWKKQLQQREKRKQKGTELAQIFEMYTAVATDEFNALMAARWQPGADHPCLATLRNMHALHEYAQTTLADLAKRYSCVTPVIGYN